MTQTPYVLSTTDLPRQPGAMVPVRTSVTSEQPLGNQVIAVPAGQAIDLDLRLESVMEGVLVSGVARAHATGECVRCLREVGADLEVDVTELFAYPGRGVQPEDDEEDPVPELVGDSLDLQPTLIDVLVTALPLRPLCRPDCGGLCPQCGIRLDDAEPGHGHEQFDPRWAALAALAGSTDADEGAPPESDDAQGPDEAQGSDGSGDPAGGHS